MSCVFRLLPSLFSGSLAYFFTFGTAITQKSLENEANNLNVLYAVFCNLSNDAGHFCLNRSIKFKL